MQNIRLPLCASMWLAPVLAAAAAASVQVTYTDPGGIGDNYGDTSVDLSSVVISNDSSNIHFTVNLNPAANLTPIGSNDYFADYEFGFQMNGGAGGQTAINTTFGTGDPTAGNPYGSAVGISSGENYFIGSFVDGPTYSGGAQLYSYNSTSGWNQIGATLPINETYTSSPGFSFSLPLSALGLTAGSTFNFDVWTTYSGGQGAYDALDNAGTGSTIAPFSGGSYDSATAPGSQFSSATYFTVSVPEPTSLLLFFAATGSLLSRQRRTRG